MTQDAYQLRVTLYWIRRFEEEKKELEAIDVSILSENMLKLHKVSIDAAQSMIDDLKAQVRVYKEALISQIVGGLYEKRLLSDIR